MGAPKASSTAPTPAPASLADLTNAYLEHLRSEKRYSPLTIDSYGRDLERFSGFLIEHLGGEPALSDLDALRPADFRSFLSRLRAEGLAPASVKRTFSAVRGWIRYLERRHGANVPGARAVRAPKAPQRLPKPLSRAAAALLLDDGTAAPHDDWQAARDIALFGLLYGAGLRISEALSLRRGDAPLGESARITGKGGKSRLVPLLPGIRSAVQAYLDVCPHSQAKDDPLFLSVTGKPFTPRMAQQRLCDLRARLNLPETATPHALRHSFATHLLAARLAWRRRSDTHKSTQTA